ncbi:MAG TPA: hypothetical protein VHX64_03965 [Caulobacteraceae bacterium]|nr:hypothetical protein [Caulobacteraceae bacterium]
MRLLSLLALAALGVAGCSQGVQPPADTGVCWHMSQFAGGKVRFNRLAQNVPTLEACAAQLEAMRIRFSALGSNPEQMIGAFQGQFLFLQPEGIFTGDSLDGPHYPFLVRSPDGRLVKPGTLPQQ